MKNRNRIIFLSSLSLLSLLSCAKEIGGGAETPVGEGAVSVLLSLEVPGARSSTRSLTAAQEDAVKTIDVFVFDRDDKLTDWKYGTLNAAGDGFTAVVDASAGPADTYRLMVLANARHLTYPVFKGSPNSVHEPGGDDLGGHIGKTYAQVYALLVAAIEQTPSDSSTEVYSANGIPMWGMMKDAQVIDESNKSFSVDMVRSVAMIDVGTNPSPSTNPDGSSVWSELPNFSLEEVYLYNSNTTYSVIPAAGHYNYTTKKVTALSLPAGVSKFPGATPMEYSDAKQAGTVTRTGGGKGYAVASAIYAAEADVVMGGTYADSKHAQRTALVVAGYYNGSSELSYYRIDFTPNGGLVNLLRNNAYQITIHSVSGPGNPDPDKAFNGFSADIDVVVNQWTPAGLAGTSIDGEYFLRVNPYELDFDKYAKTGEEVAVTTNAALSGGKSWSASRVKINAADDISWLTLTTDSGVSGGVLKFNVAAMPDGSDENDTRQAKVRFTAGTMTHDIIVRQSGKDSGHHLRLSHSELVFAGRRWDEAGQTWVDPAPQNLTIDWGPTKWDYGLDLTDYTNGGIDMTAAIPAENNTPTLTISPAAVADDNEYLVENPYFSRSSRLAVTAWDAVRGESITKQVVIRQVYYSMVVTGPVDYYFQGRSYSFNIKSNSAWVAEINGNNGLFTVTTATSGSGNTSSGQTFGFTVNAAAPVGAKATITFKSAAADPLFPPQTYDIIVQDMRPNCYMVTPGGSVTIPVTKAYRTWLLDRDLGVDLASLPGTHEVKLLWQDAWHAGSGKGIIASVGGLTSPVDKADAEFTVQTNDLTANGIAGGNAVVAYLIDGVVYWSWHIWVTDYDPETTNASTNGYTFMDRHLGAMGNSGYDAFGLFYQGGRKDPFVPCVSTSSNAFRPKYDIAGTVVPFGKIASPSAGGLPMIINNPSKFFNISYGMGFWYGAFIASADQRRDFWRIDNAVKADYDPCPGGWRVAPQESFSGILTEVPAGSINITWRGMYFPTQGFIHQSDPSGGSSVAGILRIWLSGQNSIYYFDLDSTVTSISLRASGAFGTGSNVRCVKE